MEQISAIVITKNEETCIARCLQSLTWADEIVVVDSGSTDRTLEICREFTDRVIHNDWPGSNRQKDFAVQQASHLWILSIDADEAVSSELRDSIRKALNGKTDHAGYRMLRRNYYRDMLIDFGAFHSSYELRLFRKDQGRFTDRLVHDKVILDGSRGTLPGYIEHYNIDNLQEWLQKNLRYAALSADQSIMAGRKVSWWSFAKPFGRFLRRYFFRRGYRYGIAGLVFSLLPEFFGVMKCAMIWDRQNRTTEPSSTSRDLTPTDQPIPSPYEGEG